MPPVRLAASKDSCLPEMVAIYREAQSSREQAEKAERGHLASSDPLSYLSHAHIRHLLEGLRGLPELKPDLGAFSFTFTFETTPY